MGKVLDQYGNPIESKALTDVIAGADMYGQRPAVIATPPIGLNPEVLGSALRAADAGDSLAWQTIAEIIEEKDPHYQGVLGTRKRSVGQLPITVDAASPDPAHEKHAEFIRDWLRLGLVEHSSFDILDAIGKGFSVHELTWQLSPGCNRIVEMDYRPQRWFEPSYQDGETILIRDDNADPAAPCAPGAPSQPGFRDMPPYKFLVHKHKSWSGMTLRAGMTRTVAFFVMFKHFTSRDWGLFVQSYGLPLRIGKFGAGASEEQKRVLARAVFNLMGASGAIIPDSMQVDFIEPKHGAGSNDIHQRRCDWIDAQISKVVLGQTGTTDSKQGAHASGAIHRLVQEDIERFDASLLSITLQKQAVIPQIDLTFGAQSMGQYPRLRVGRPGEPSITEVTNALQWLGPQGVTVRATEVRQRLGFSEPEDGDEVVGGRAPLSAPTAAHTLPAKTRPDQIKPPHDNAPNPKGGNEQTTLHSRIVNLVERNGGTETPALIDAMSSQLATRAAKAWSEMSVPVQNAIKGAADFDEAQDRIAELELPIDAFAQALEQSVQLAYLMGDALALDQMRHDNA